MPIVPRGGGTGLMGGAVRDDGRRGAARSSACARVRELEPGLWRMLPEAGVSTRDVQRLARENGLMFAPDPGAAEQSQIGGNVATNAGGPHALKYGVTGAWVSGLEVVLAPGELVAARRLGGKDVAGYDLKSLLIGSEGTLGRDHRGAPAPAAGAGGGDRAGRVPAHPRARAARRSTQVFAAGLRPSVLDFLDGETLAIARAPRLPRRRQGARGGGLRADRRGGRLARGGRGAARRR